MTVRKAVQKRIEERRHDDRWRGDNRQVRRGEEKRGNKSKEERRREGRRGGKMR